MSREPKRSPDREVCHRDYREIPKPAKRNSSQEGSGGATRERRTYVRARDLMCYIEARAPVTKYVAERVARHDEAVARCPGRVACVVWASREETASLTTLNADGWGSRATHRGGGVIQRKSSVRHVGVGPETGQDLP